MPFRFRMEGAVDLQQCVRQAPQRLGRIAQAGHGQGIVRLGHFQFNMVSLPQQVHQSWAGQIGAAGTDDDLAGIKGKKVRVTGRSVFSVTQKPQMPQFCRPAVEGFQVLSVCLPQRRSLPFQQGIAVVQGPHQEIGRAAGLKNSQLPGKLLRWHQIGVPVGQRRLREAGQRLVGALDHQIRPRRHSSGRQPGCKP